MPDERGVVSLDASIMYGPTFKCGSVASLENIKKACSVARLVMERTDHAMIVGAGALAFAKAHGFPEENLLTEEAQPASPSLLKATILTLKFTFLNPPLT